MILNTRQTFQIYLKCKQFDYWVIIGIDLLYKYFL